MDTRETTAARATDGESQQRVIGRGKKLRKYKIIQHENDGWPTFQLDDTNYRGCVCPILAQKLASPKKTWLDKLCV